MLGTPREAIGNERNNLALAVRELGEDRREVGLLGHRRTRSQGDRPLQHLALQHAAPRHHRAQRRGHPRHVLFDEVACSAQRKGAHDVLVVGEGGEKDHARRSRGGEDLLGGGKAVHPRHLDVEKNDVRCGFGRQAHGVCPIRPTACDLDVGLCVQHNLERLHHHGVVVCYDDPHVLPLSAR